jgi:peptide/nickel transport system permease protein
MGSAVILESTLSFLGLGLAPDHVSWGMLLNGARKSLSSWWMVVFPAVAILFTVLSFNAIARSMSAYFSNQVSYSA